MTEIKTGILLWRQPATWRILQRNPTQAEIDRGVRLIATLEKEDGKAPDEALALFCLVSLNLNEFVYLD